MSIWTTLFTGSSGIAAHGEAIGVVGDNIANISTVGFQSSRAGFEDILGGASSNGQRLGTGVAMGGTQTNFSQGSLQETGRNLDLAIRGKGFFAVKGSHDGLPGTYFSRDGRFNIGKDGLLVNQEGLRVQGYTIDPSGGVSPSTGDLNVQAQSQPRASTQVSLIANLDASAATPAVQPFAAANAVQTSNFSTSTNVFDSLGVEHRIDTYFVKTGAGAWAWHALVDGGQLTGGAAGTPTEVATGTLNFTNGGALNTQLPAGTQNLNFAGAAQAQPVRFSFGDDLATAGGTGLKGVTQFSGESRVKDVTQDGFSAGDLLEVSVGQDGIITGHFSNGQSRSVARVALATFAGEEGLRRVGNQLFGTSTASGAAVLAAASTGSRGSIAAGTTESSNVDLGLELVTLIQYQRAFQASSKTVSTADEMLQELTSLKR